MQPLDWQTVACGSWREDTSHNGHVEYRIAQSAVDQWMLESVERNADLDGVTEEDVEAGKLNDDQIQAIWGMTLEEAQAQEYRRIVAICNEVPAHIATDDLIRQVFDQLAKSGGKLITEPGDCWPSE